MKEKEGGRGGKKREEIEERKEFQWREISRGPVIPAPCSHPCILVLSLHNNRPFFSKIIKRVGVHCTYVGFCSVKVGFRVMKFGN